MVDTRFDGEALLRARDAKGLSRRQLAKTVRARPGEHTIAQFEQCAKEPNPRMIVALAAALAVDPLQLLHLPNGLDLRALRLTAGRTEQQVAQSTHVAPRSYRKWESGRSLPSGNERIIEALAQEMSVSTAQIRAALKRTSGTQPTDDAFGQRALPDQSDGSVKP